MHHMLRVAFPTKIKSAEFSSDIQYGFVKRSTYRNTSWEMAKFETVAHRYVDLSDQHYGVALLNDCKYGHKVYENVIDLNLLRSPTEPDPVADQGHHEFTYSFLPHIGTLIDSDVIKEAAMLNTQPVIFENLAMDSTSLSPVILNADGISLEVVKRAEKDNSIILRLVETKGCYSEGTMEVINKNTKLTETDMLEWNDSGIIDSTQPINLIFQPFEIRTYRIKL
jgi:alpha-mannosidase